jgi:RsiW-degrading membrane proteinase PrsW (M82 family)
MIVVAYVIAILLPLGFLYLIYSQDLFGQGKFKFVLLSFAWGLAAFGGAYGIASLIQWRLTVFFGSVIEAGLWLELWLPVLIAPIVEEILKSLHIVTFLRKRITYFVDGAIYGFAAGIAFSVLENILYLARGGTRSGTLILIAILRVFSTCLMHGAASALVGVAIGRLRYGRGAGRALSAGLGWVLAIGLHMGFNRLARLAENMGQSSATAGRAFLPLLGAIGLGIAGAVLIVVFIRRGLAEQKRWIQETLGIGTGVSRVTRQEVARVQQYEQVDKLLAQIEEYFGEEKADAVELFLLKQAQMGIKRKARAMSQVPAEQEKLGGEIEALFQEMEQLRRKVGVYAMSFVREVLPEEVLEDLSLLLNRQMEVQAAKREAEGGAVGPTLDEKLSQALEERVEQVQGPEGSERPARRGLFDLVQDKQDGPPGPEVDA